MIDLIDIIDIAVASVLIYGLIILLKQTRSRNIIEGIFILVFIYVAALILQLELLISIFRIFVPVVLIALVVIFQEEFRRFFEFLGILPSRYRITGKNGVQANPVVEKISEAVLSLSKRKMGAIIVLQGNESLEIHAKGGIPLMGNVSGELLESLFDKKSPTHDGAVIIHIDTIKKFSAHLPLSRKTSQLGNLGTRHAAALGLAERTDALVIVVSEERGGISIAANGRLKRLGKDDDVKKLIRNFYKTKFPENPKTAWSNAVKSHPIDKALAIIIAAALWYFLVNS